VENMGRVMMMMMMAVMMLAGMDGWCYKGKEIGLG
jgi:hypothetical protein